MKEVYYQNNENPETILKTIAYESLYPGGNTTALIEGMIDDQLIRTQINRAIMLNDNSVEQVGFYDLSNIFKPKLQMAGSEFCVNGTRALAYLACLKSRGKIKNFEIEVLLEGQSLILKVGVSRLRQSWLELPVPDSSISVNEEMQIVPLLGITQVVVKDKFPKDVDESTLKATAQKILKQLNLLDTVPAAGVVFVSTNSQGLAIKPVVWVKAIKTFFYETACGSATIAAYWTFIKQRNRCCIQQPSGIALEVETMTASTDNQEMVLKISGPVSRIK